MLGVVPLTDALLDAWAVVVPVECAGCGDHDRALCRRCRAAIAPRVARRTVASLEVSSGLRYAGEVREVILALKEGGRTGLARPLALSLSAALADALAAEDAEAAVRAGGSVAEIVRVPGGRAAFRRRGFDPVALLLRRAGVDPVPVLEATRATRSQKTLDLSSRAVNLAGSIRASRPLAGRRFVLVDDVVTTGATLAEAARALREGGGSVDRAATLADTPRRFPRRAGGLPNPGRPANDFAVRED